MYVSIRNSDFWDASKIEFNTLERIEQPVNFWQKGKAGYILSIIIFSLGLLFLVVGVIMLISMMQWACVKV